MSAMSELDLMLKELQEARSNVASYRTGSGSWFLAVQELLEAADELFDSLRPPPETGRMHTKVRATPANSFGRGRPGRVQEK